MFTGIVETTGRVVASEKSGTSICFTIESPVSQELKMDQSVAHDGVCLTVTGVHGNTHTVTVVSETLQKTNLKFWEPGRIVNLERSLKLSSLVDGHLVQGHIDTVAVCEAIRDELGSHLLYFTHPEGEYFITVPKGSVCINGVSLTVVNSSESRFSVVLIPYTFKHTSFCQIVKGHLVNVEFDIIGKYVKKLMRN
ncbi:MAG: riboflavin synthase [Bacteroidia bacterium]|nr:riboflavin synthase [Bacteroidia bacterium]MCZ2276690.1 riboflavin synthase [Bacteroidia bacterium]